MDGRYLIEMPFKPELSEIMLGNSKEITSKRLITLFPAAFKMLSYYENSLYSIS